MEDDEEEDGTERRGKARWKEAATVTVEAIAMGMVRRCRVCFTSAASGRSNGRAARQAHQAVAESDGASARSSCGRRWEMAR